MLPESVKARLTAHLGDVRRQHQRDLSEGLGYVTLPAALERKYPNAATDWSWQFVFPAARICRDPRLIVCSEASSRFAAVVWPVIASEDPLSDVQHLPTP